MAESINTSKILCPHFERCSGCQLNEAVDKPPILDEVQRFFELQGLKNLRVIAGPARGWRCRAKLAVRGTAEHSLIGLFKEDSHDVVNIPECQVHHPNINRAVEAVKTLIQKERIAPYIESSGGGVLRYLQMVVQRSTGRVQLTFVINEETLDVATQTLWGKRMQELIAIAPDLWHSLWLNGNTRRDNVIMGAAWWRGWGDEFLWETLGNAQIAFKPASFGQANLNLFETILEELRLLVPGGSRVAEFYAGVGVIGLNLVNSSSEVRCCEINRSGEACFEASLDKLNLADRQKISFHYGQAGGFIDWISESDVVIVDPPRRGLDEPLLQALTAQEAEQAKRLVYVSCGWKPFQRNCEALLQAGWLLGSASVYLLFPGTNQVELVVCFDRD
jgi:23S rRNA (uracil1939-C5)-methyltransferase